MNTFSLKSEKARMPTLIASIQHCTSGCNRSNQARKRNKVIKIKKEEVKLYYNFQKTWFDYPENPVKSRKNTN